MMIAITPAKIGRRMKKWLNCIGVRLDYLAAKVAWEAHGAEHSRREEIIRVADDRASPDRSGILADPIVGKVERAAPVVAGFVLQTDFGDFAGGTFAPL